MPSSFQAKPDRFFSGSQTTNLSTIPFALVVDDDVMILMDACDILERTGFPIHEAANGDDAKAFLAVPVDNVILLFSDVEMPGETNGFALARYVAEP